MGFQNLFLSVLWFPHHQTVKDLVALVFIMLEVVFSFTQPIQYFALQLLDFFAVLNAFLFCDCLYSRLQISVHVLTLILHFSSKMIFFYMGLFHYFLFLQMIDFVSFGQIRSNYYVFVLKCWIPTGNYYAILGRWEAWT